MIPSPRPHGFVPVPQAQPWQPLPPAASSFWQPRNVQDHIRKVQETMDVSKVMLNELEALLKLKTGSGSANEEFLKVINEKEFGLDTQESLSIEAANSICSHLKALLAPLASVTDQGTWEERSLAVKSGQKMQKSKRNKLWRKRKRRRIAELLSKECEDYDKVDQAADDWRAQEIAKDIAKRKVESMKQIAKKKADEEKKRLESELELILIVEKLKELRSIRIEKLKKQGHFFPEEDDKFLDRVRAAVEEEEVQAASAASTNAAMDAIATAEGSRKSSNQSINQSNDIMPCDRGDVQVEAESSKTGGSGLQKDVSGGREKEVYGNLGINLPVEFYHYYHGSSYDMGTLIEVRRAWDAYLRPGGSRIPGHWVQPPPPSNEVWASYLVRPSSNVNQTR